MLSLLFATLLGSATPALAFQDPVSPPQAEVGQEAPTRPTRRGARGPKLAANDPAAEAFLEKLVAAQLTEEDLPPVSAFAMAFQLRDYAPDRGVNTLEVEVSYRQSDASFRMLAHDSSVGETVAKGFDQEGYWLRTKDEELVTLEAKEFANDREVIDMTMTFCEDFLLLFDLSQLRKRAGGLKLAETEEFTMLTGEMQRGRREIWKFSLSVPRGAALPTALVLELPKKEVQAEPRSEETQVIESGDAKETSEDPASAQKEPQFLLYEFGDWTAHAGRLLPAFLDEFHTRDPEGLPRRSVDIRLFRWREAEKIPTSR